jgi:hypothetical protein
MELEKVSTVSLITRPSHTAAQCEVRVTTLTPLAGEARRADPEAAQALAGGRRRRGHRGCVLEQFGAFWNGLGRLVDGLDCSKPHSDGV